jgi:hypothetical protein
VVFEVISIILKPKYTAMKHLISTVYTSVVFAVTFSLSSCSKSDLIKPAPSQQTAVAEELLNANADVIVGRYKITRFIEDGKNETSRFTGYRFAFQADSDFVARTNSGEIVEGNWALDTTGTVITIEHFRDGSLDKLVGDWKIIEATVAVLY